MVLCSANAGHLELRRARQASGDLMSARIPVPHIGRRCGEARKHLERA